MKAQFLAVSLALASFAAFGQDTLKTSPKGKFGIGGSLGYFDVTGSGVQSPDLTGAYLSYKIAPSFSFFTTNKVMAGLGLGYQHSQYHGMSSASVSTFSVSPMVQYLIPLGSDKFGMYMQGYLSFGLGKVKYAGSSSGVPASDLTNFTGGISPGIYFFPSRKFMLNASFGSIFKYSKTTTKSESFLSSTGSSSGRSLELLNFSTTGQNILGLQIGGMFLF